MSLAAPSHLDVLTPAVFLSPGRLRILVVEDDFLIGMLLGEMLEMMGHEVCATETTQTGAIAAAAKWHPTMIVIDAQLREGSGLSAIDQILKSGYVPHVFVTGDIRGVLNRRPRYRGRKTILRSRSRRCHVARSSEQLTIRVC
jgi:two-component system, response regulator PdtaR